MDGWALGEENWLNCVLHVKPDIVVNKNINLLIPHKTNAHILPTKCY